MQSKVNGHGSRTHGHVERSKKVPHARGGARQVHRPEAPPQKKHATFARTPFPPIADYAFLSDCQVNALVALDGAIEWLCTPRHDGPSVFAAVLDRDAGFFRLGPVGVSVPSSRSYLPGSLVLETVWQTPTGWITVRDALCMTPWRHLANRDERYRRPPPDWEPAGMIVRTIECTYGHVELELKCLPAFEYGTRMPQWSYASEGYGEARATCEGSTQSLLLASDMRLGLEPRMVRTRTLLERGQHAYAALSWGEMPPPRSYEEARALVEGTTDYWRRWLDRGTFPDHPWRSLLQRSALTIKGLTYAPSGALLAAATTSLPETPGGNRNWDYRFTWLRDSVYTLRVLQEFGYEVEARDYTLFLTDTISSPDKLQIMYGIGGETTLTERELPHLAGYEGARPVRIGNGAFDQKQHDTWGNLMRLLGMQIKRMRYVPEPIWKMIKSLIAQMAAHWREPDRGIWEVRGEPKHFVSSKVMCWSAAHTGAELAAMKGDAELEREWSALAEQIHAEVCKKGVDERGVFTQYYGTKALDASNLLMTELGFLPPDDPRLRATVLAIADELTVDGLVLRYRTGETDDGLSGEEGTFSICSFWLVSALAYIGELERARRLCEKLLTFASPLGLYAEEIDAASSRHLGNFPQAFSHLSQVDAMLKLIRAEENAPR